MHRLLIFSFITIFSLLAGACAPKNQSELKKMLSVAVKEKMVSPEKMENILREYEMLRKEENKKAGEYAAQIINALKMGGDSTHIDVVRKQVMGKTLLKAV